MAQSLAFDLPLGNDDATHDEGTVFILWVDDVPSNNTYEVNSLTRSGCEIVCKVSTADAIAWFEQNEDKKNDPCFRVITDRVRYGNVNAGIELIDWMRTNGWNTPVLVYTGSHNLPTATQKFGNLIVTSVSSQVFAFAQTVERGSDKGLKAKTDVFDGCVFCLSGEFSVSRGDMEKLIFTHGGRLARGMTDQVTHLLCATDGQSGVMSGKYQRAISQGIPIVHEAFIHEAVKTGVLPSVAVGGSSGPSLAAVSAGMATLGTTKEKIMRKEGGKTKTARVPAKGFSTGPKTAPKKKVSTKAKAKTPSKKTPNKKRKRADSTTSAPKAKKPKFVDQSKFDNPYINPAQNIFACDKILRERIVKGKTEYLVKWSGEPASKATWEPKANVSIDKTLLKEWNDYKKGKR